MGKNSLRSLFHLHVHFVDHLHTKVILYRKWQYCKKYSWKISLLNFDKNQRFPPLICDIFDTGWKDSWNNQGNDFFPQFWQNGTIVTIRYSFKVPNMTKKCHIFCCICSSRDKHHPCIYCRSKNIDSNVVFVVFYTCGHLVDSLKMALS